MIGDDTLVLVVLIHRVRISSSLVGRKL